MADATMFMIKKDLVRNRRKSTLYYQMDRLWKKLQTKRKHQICHDVFENNRLILKTSKFNPLLSTRYEEEKLETGRNLGLKPRCL